MSRIPSSDRRAWLANRVETHGRVDPRDSSVWDAMVADFPLHDPPSVSSLVKDCNQLVRDGKIDAHRAIVRDPVTLMATSQWRTTYERKGQAPLLSAPETAIRKVAGAAERHNWIIRQVREKGQVSLWDVAFVVTYAKLMGAPSRKKVAGPPLVPLLAADLRRLHKGGKLVQTMGPVRSGRVTIGVPRRIATYTLPPQGETT